jgi:hypothetical protein
VWLALELIFALYAISFAWFWSLCRLSVHKTNHASTHPTDSNLIPFERGLELQDRAKTGT